MARRTSTAWVVMEKPATRASPEEAGNKVVSILMVVVLPAPLEPSKAKTSPALTDRVRASTAVKAPKRRVRACRSNTISFISKVRARLPKRLDQRLKLRWQRFGVRRDGRHLPLDTQQLVDGRLRGSHRILHGKDAVIRNFDKLADEGEILGAGRHRQRPVAQHAGHEHAGDVRHSARNA